LVLGVAAAIKPHTAVILPLAAVYALATRMSVVRVLASGVVIVAVFVAAFAPFHTQALSQLPSFVDARWNETMKQYHFATVNAMNLWYLLGQNWHPDKALVGNAISMHAIGQALTIGTIVAAVAWAAWRTRAVGSAALWQAASLTYLGTFLFVTRAHERHVFPYFPMAMAAAATAPQVLIPYAMVSAATLANLGLAWRYMLPGKQSAELCPPVVGGGICLVILAALPLTWISFTNKGALWVEKGRAWLGGIGPRPIVRTQVAGNVAGDSESVRHGKLWLLAILVFALGIRLVRLNAPPERFFDEVYHAYTAERWLMGDKAAWFTGRAPDKDCAYEWTHPPLAKEFMWASLKVFGVHPWAWRLPAALFGTCCVALIYGLGLTLFRSERIALYAAAFATLDTLPLVLSRIGMNDIYMVGFMLAAVLAALRKRDVLAAALVGCAIACKWSGVFALPLLGLIHVVWVVPEKRWDVLAWVRRGLAYGLLVPGIYIASYIPFFQAGYTVKDFREIQWQMQHYHRNLKATHSFSSPAITWPFTYKQVWCYTHRYEPRASDAGIPAANPPTNRGVKVANVYALGNPAIWLAGLGALGLAAYTVIGTRNAALFIIIAGYLAFWVLWLFSPRIMFLYHYLPSLSFLYLALAWALPQLDPKGSNARFALILAFVVLVILYPYATAVPIPIWLTAGNWFRMT
jgi:dolichyl-phosphate-mannose--protein O-mannosyl transferase